MEGMKKLFLFALFLVGFSAAVQAQNLQVTCRIQCSGAGTKPASERNGGLQGRRISRYRSIGN